MSTADNIQQFEKFTHPDNFGEKLGYRITRFDRDAREAHVYLMIREDHLSAAAKAHGGVLAALLDYACGVAVCTTLGAHDLCSTVELKVNYFRPVMLGDELTAVARVAFRGKKLCAMTAMLERAAETQPVAMASATYNIVHGEES